MPSALLAAISLNAQILPEGSTLETQDENSNLVQLVTDPMGFGWYTQDATVWESTYLTDFVDYLVAKNDGSDPGLRYEKAGASVLSLESVNLVGEGGSNALRNQPLTFFSFDDGADEFFDQYIETDYFGVSWVGDLEGLSSMSWRVDGGGDLYQVIHWWNHGLYDEQHLTVTLYSADGTARASSASDFLWPGNDGGNLGFTSFITVYPVAADDYLIIENQGTNVGWRATAFYYPEIDEPYSLYPLEATVEGYHFDDVFGYLYVYDNTLGLSTYLGNVFVQSYPWLYQFPLGWLYHLSGDYESGLYLYSPEMGYLFTLGSYGGYYYRYDTDSWSTFF
jgi:hypothetical protein